MAKVPDDDSGQPLSPLDGVDLTEYAPETHPGLLIEHMRRGYSFDTFAAFCGVAQRDTQRWLKTHLPFRIAYEKGQVLALYYWEQKLMGGLEYDGKVNDKLLLFLAEKRFSAYGTDEAISSMDKRDSTLDPIVEMKRLIGK